ncbi:MAG: hypothetical protein CMO74_15190 [Verrucomicrobiales bacterium]|nr:hypothetical protein [Verrucomicrobiales bacterium]MBL69764.1 hypothetical protein [Verrucomicrobiales bacterium]
MNWVDGSQQAMNAPKLDAPIVLAHGMLGLMQGLFGGGRIENYFHGIPDWLRATGNEVIVTEVPGIGSITRKAEALRKGILTATKVPTHVIGHSQGGLDARHMVTHLGTADRVISLTTIASPHRGSPIADWGVATADATGVLQMMDASPLDTEAFHDLGSARMAEFNRQTPNVKEVRYRSIVGECPREQMLPTLRLCHDHIVKIEGPNDGLVSTVSAHWGEDCTVWQADHSRQIGWFSDGDFDWKQHWATLLNNLAD